jgi:alpha-L-fucosidase
MFIHFGLYSIPGGVWQGVPMGRNWYAEWIQMQGNWPHGIAADEYRGLCSQFNPTAFDADEWIAEMANAGMRYLIVTAKHHDGFALWPSKVSAYNVVDATPFRRDVLGELAGACQRRGIRLCLYYSHWLDWDHPFGGRSHESEFFSEPRWQQPTDEQFEVYWRDKCLPQVAELIDSYHPGLLWFDTWAPNSSAWINARRIDEMLALIRGRDPNCLVNSRIGVWGHPKGDAVVDVLSMDDNAFPPERLDRPWETPGTMNRSYGHHQLDFRWQTSKAMLKHLINNASRGGNYEIDIGPMGDGRFAPPALRRLREVGAWMTVHGEAIYGTGPNPFEKQSWGEVTTGSLDSGSSGASGLRRIYLHLFAPQPGAHLVLRGLSRLPAAAHVLETGQPVTVAQAADGVAFTLPDEMLDDGIPVVAMDLVAG